MAMMLRYENKNSGKNSCCWVVVNVCVVTHAHAHARAHTHTHTHTHTHESDFKKPGAHWPAPGLKHHVLNSKMVEQLFMGRHKNAF